ncbi:MAG: hypothetical protein JW881_00670 [Spirochaetales bacterium]|nr:hypothetical protein [Spirochaetales bacterium]
MKKLIILVSLVVPLFPFLAVDTINDDLESGDAAAVYGRSMITIDNSYNDWSMIPEVASFSAQGRPYTFNREKDGILESLSIDKSIYWGHNGTNLKSIKAFLGSDTIAFHISSYSPFSDGLILFLYLFKERNKGEPNYYTIEINIDVKQRNGIVYLWERGGNDALEIGTAAVNTEEFECEFSIEALPLSLREDFIASYSFDLTTCYYNRVKRTYEEFFFTTLKVKNIPSSQDI